MKREHQVAAVAGVRRVFNMVFGIATGFIGGGCLAMGCVVALAVMFGPAQNSLDVPVLWLWVAAACLVLLGASFIYLFKSYFASRMHAPINRSRNPPA